MVLIHTTSHAKRPVHERTGKDKIKMKLIPSGSFIMGSKDADMLANSMPHKVFIAGFYMDEHPVTNRQFAMFLNDIKEVNTKDSDRYNWMVTRDDIDSKERKDWWPTEITFENDKFMAYEGFEDYPVISVSWVGAKKYCKWAGKRLPTEAEWEKAARGGLKKALFAWGNALPTDGIIYNRVWKINLDPPPLENVKYGTPNGYGLHNMGGMLWEWCSDWYAPNYYKQSPLRNPLGPETGEEKVLRGGSWFNGVNALRVALRNFMPPEALDESTGLRCASDIPIIKSKTSKKDK